MFKDRRTKTKDGLDNPYRRNLVAAAIVFLLGYWVGLGQKFTNEWGKEAVRIEVIKSKSSSAVEESRISSDSVNESDGWHPIYVYHGNQGLEGVKGPGFPTGSQAKQDKIVMALTSDEFSSLFSTGGKQKRYFVDLAANDAEALSNTLLLEENGWEGLCIEPNPIYWYRLAHRRCAIAAAFVGGVEDAVPVDVHLGDGMGRGAFGGIVDNEMDNKNKPPSTTERRYTVSLPTAFQKFHVPSVIDYFSLDVEGAESLIMKDFPFTKFLINIMTVERPKPDLRTLLTANGLVYVMDLTKWGETLWVHNSSLTKSGITVDLIKEVVGKL